jgi:YfiH family protein
MSNLIGRMPPHLPPVHDDFDAAPDVATGDRIDVMTWELLAGQPIDAAVTTRHGGVSVGAFASLNLGLHVGDDPDAVVENRRRALGLLGAGLDDLVVPAQVHGAGAVVVGRAEAGRGSRSVADELAGVDAVVTTEPGLVLCVLAADCAPVVLWDPAAAVLACVHAGWRGALGGVLEAAVGTMAAHGARPEHMLAGIGPTIAADRYEVGADVLAALEAHLGSTEAWCRPGRTGHWWFDLAGAVRSALERAGLDPANVETSAASTGPPQPFYSFRAEGNCGRFALLARLRP